ncbi:MAG: hypothetical protein Q7T18_12230 [Sedimentisphaerales bacterium]|nr:hypothetical protein [Sedimentisphaerales bacterium]
MTSEKDLQQTLEKLLSTMEEICEHIRAIRRVANRVLDQLHDLECLDDELSEPDYDPDQINWQDMNNNDDMFS